MSLEATPRSAFCTGCKNGFWRVSGFRQLQNIEHIFREAKSLIYNLDNNSEPVMYNGEIEDSNSNYFVLRLADHAQFYAFNNKTDKVQKVVVLVFTQSF